MNNLVVYFHLRWAKGQELIPASKRELLVVGIGKNKDGPFFGFEKRDQKVTSHKYFKNVFLKHKIKKKPFTKYANDKQLLNGLVLDEYYDSENKKFWFNKLHLIPIKEFELDYSSCQQLDDSNHINEISSVENPQLNQLHVDFSNQIQMIRSIPEYSLDQITKTATEIKKKGLKTFDSISHEPHIWLNEFEKLVSTNIGMEKEVILEFLDEISLDFYYKITRFDQNIAWSVFKTSFIDFINHYKVLKMKEERELIYSQTSKLYDFVTNKYEKINFLYPSLNDQTKIRMIIASLGDEILQKQFSKLVTNNIGLFMRNVILYDRQNFPDPSTNIRDSIDYNITDYYSFQQATTSTIATTSTTAPTSSLNNQITNEMRNLAMNRRQEQDLISNNQQPNGEGIQQNTSLLGRFFANATGSNATGANANGENEI